MPSRPPIETDQSEQDLREILKKIVIQALIDTDINLSTKLFTSKIKGIVAIQSYEDCLCIFKTLSKTDLPKASAVIITIGSLSDYEERESFIQRELNAGEVNAPVQAIWDADLPDPILCISVRAEDIPEDGAGMT
ncbi:MAG: hypothetical protein HGA25_03185, partial [Clostridiales bacterium]|nr:hypothetical protein [Clostridiales bacterium]